MEKMCFRLFCGLIFAGLIAGVALTGCGESQSVAADAPVAAATPKPAAKPLVKNAKVWFGSTPLGTTADLSAFTNKLKQKIEDRATNGPTKPAPPIDDPGSDPSSLEALTPPAGPIYTVYLRVDANVSVGDVLRLCKAVDEAGGTPFLLRDDPKPGPTSAKADPNVFLITIGDRPRAVPGIPAWDDEGRFSSELLLRETDRLTDLWVGRSFVGGIEIEADGSYIFNQKYENYDKNGSLADYPPKQRPMAKTELTAELTRELPGAARKMENILLIADAAAPFRSLADLRQAAGDLKVRLQVDVHETGY